MSTKKYGCDYLFYAVIQFFAIQTNMPDIHAHTGTHAHSKHTHRYFLNMPTHFNGMTTT